MNALERNRERDHRHAVAMVRLCREALSGPLGYWERLEAREALERWEREAEQLAHPLGSEAARCPVCGGERPGDISHTRC